jgi:hypothetical protein
MGNILLYLICFLFAAVGSVAIVISENIKDALVGITMLLLWLGLGIGLLYNRLGKSGKKENKNIEQEGVITITCNRVKMLALMLMYLCLGVACNFMLPFYHIFDNSSKYSPAVGWVVGLGGVLSFGFAFIVAIIRLINPRIAQISDEGIVVYSPVVGLVFGWGGWLIFGFAFIVAIIRLINSRIAQISDEGIVVPKGIKNQVFIAWKDIENIRRNGTFLHLYLNNEGTTETNIKLNLSAANYGIEEIESLIISKL